jgi:class 3 adenylate cyclase/tetratricopeptide (TPR) repeat protein
VSSDTRACARCQGSNRPEARFCDGCGTPLVLSCAGCGAELRAKARFCDDCGAPVARAATEARPVRDYTPRHLVDKVLATRASLEGERKQVTVLFADVKGSLELSRAVDPEVWHAILERFFTVLTDAVHRFEGTVNQYTGDGIMALFGAPIAHEDHAQRACYAALQIRDDLAPVVRDVKREHGLGFSTRVGIHSGEVVVGKIGDDLRMDYTAQGATVGLAARMEQLASPDTVYLSDTTARLVDGYFALDDLGEFPVKGLDAPVRVHQLTGIGALRTRFEVSRARGLTRFVGRDSDMTTLEAAFAQASAGNGQVVGVVAPAGTGKSRLCFEFLERCRSRAVPVIEGHALSHGKNIPFLPMLEIFRDYYGITAQDDPRTIREKIAGRLLLLDESFREALPIVFENFGAPDPSRPAPPMDAEARQRLVFSVLRRVVRGEDEPFVAFLDDLHWLDPTSELFLAQWVDALQGARSLLLVNFRPEFHAEWMQRSWYRQIALAPLGPEAIQELLDDLLGRDPSVAGLAARIHQRTGGNPFFTEEVVQGLIESGKLEGKRGAYRLIESVDRLEIPASVTSLLASRIDRLAEREKHVLQAAAVLGKTFEEPLLEAIADVPQADLHAALDALKRGEFLYEQSLYPVAEYAFKHPLTQEVALGSQLGERRKKLHAAAAQALEVSLAARLDESAALLAHHWEQAGRPREAARWQRRAAQWVRGRDSVQSIRHWQRVRALTAELDDDEESQRFALEACSAIATMGGWRLGLSAAEMTEVGEQGRALAERFGDRNALLRILVAEALRKGVGGDTRSYYEGAAEAGRLIDDSVDLESRLVVQVNRGYSAWSMGLLPEALREIEEVGALAGSDLRAGFEGFGFSAAIWTDHMAGWALAYLGRLDDSHARFLAAIRRARENDFKENLGWAVACTTAIPWLRGAPMAGLPEPRAAALEALEIAEGMASRYSRAAASFNLVQAHLATGNFEDAAQSASEGLALVREHETARETEVGLLGFRAQALLALGNATAALPIAREAVALAAAQPSFMSGVEACCALAQALLAHEGVAARAEIEAAIAQAFAWLEESGAEALRPRVLESRAALAAALGDAATQGSDLAEALRLYRAMGAAGHVARLAGSDA